MVNLDITLADKFASLSKVARYRPLFTTGIIGFSVIATLLEAIGVSFILPIIRAAEAGNASVQNTDGIVGLFFEVYSFLGIPFTLEYMILGIMLAMSMRYTSSFISSWLAIKLSKEYEQYFKLNAFNSILNVEISYYDEKGTDDVLNAIITQTRYAGKVIRSIVNFVQQVLLSVVYITLALVMAPILTVAAAVLLGGITYLVRQVIEPGYTVGDRVAEANEEVQKHAQAGAQGIREIKLFGVTEDVYDDFQNWVETYTTSSIEMRRNKVGIQSSYELLTAIMLFGLLYMAIEVLTLSISALGVFLFAMFRLAPRISNLNAQIYTIESQLPHLVRTHQFINRLEDHEEEQSGSRTIRGHIERVAFDQVSFSYEENDPVLRNVSFDVTRGDFVGFVGQSGAGKSTIVSLLARMYPPDSGEITANDIPIDELDIREWRDRLAMVRQNPFIFNESLRYNITLGKDYPQSEIKEVAEITKLTEFLPGLPKGFDTVLGEEGVKLSGGQRQRVALARALIADAEIVILDEATSDLDSNLEQQIHSAIASLDDDRFIFAIAHRLSTVQDADMIYTVENGKITERGSHESLLENDGKYAELYGIQS